MQPNKVKNTQKQNNVEFQALHKRLFLRYLAKHVRNKVLFKSAPLTEADKAAAQNEAEHEAKTEAKNMQRMAENKQVYKEDTNKVKAKSNLQPKKAKKANKETYDPVKVLSKIESEENGSNEIIKASKPGVLQTVVSYISTLSSNNSQSKEIKTIKKQQEDQKNVKSENSNGVVDITKEAVAIVKIVAVNIATLFKSDQNEGKAENETDKLKIKKSQLKSAV